MEEPSHMTERILNLTLEIIYLLTRENYMAFKISDGLVTSNEMKTQSPIIESQSLKQNNKKDQEVTSDITELLTGENYITFKLSKGFVSASLKKTQSSVIEPPSHLLGKNMNVQDVIREIIELLTGEEGQRLEGHEDLYKDVMMENRPPLTSPDQLFYKDVMMENRPPLTLSDQLFCKDTMMENRPPLTSPDQLFYKDTMMENQLPLTSLDQLFSKDTMMENRPPLTSPDGSSNGNTPERCPSPLSSQDSEDHKIPQDDQVILDANQINCRLESNGKVEEPSVVSDELCKEEYIPPEIRSDARDTRDAHGDVKAEKEREMHFVIKEEEIPVEIGTDPGNIRTTKRDLKAEEEEEEWIKEEDCTIHLNRAGKHDRNNLVKHHIPLENPTTTTFFLLPSGDLSSVPSTHGGSFPDCSSPMVHHPSARGGETFRCAECGDCFSKRELLMVHKSSHTKPLSSESAKNVPRKLYVIEHELIPMKPYSCSECGKCFTQKGHVVLHQRTHTGEKPYSCSECGKGFPAKSALSKHKRMHTGEKPFSCSECGKSFSFNSALTKHKKTHTGEKPYSCSDCGRCFSQRDHLIAHQKTHTGEKPFSCSECGKSFAKKGNLETHQTIHTGDRPYSCSVCGKDFRSKSNLLRHKKVHRGVKPHACPECGKPFKTEFALSLHRRSHEAPSLTLLCTHQV